MGNKTSIVCVIGAIFSVVSCCIHAQVYIEGYGGGVGGFAKSSGSFTNTNGISGLNRIVRNTCSYKLCATGLGGIKFGGWFAQKNSHTMCSLENFGFYVDVNHHSLTSRSRTSQITYIDNSLSPAQQATTTALSKFAHGGLTTIGFMCAYRYVVHPDSHFSCLEPYIAFGPAAMVLTHNRFLIGPHEADNGYFTVIQSNTSTLSSKARVIPGLVVDTGLHGITYKNVFFDLFFKYRFAHGTWLHNYNVMKSRVSFNLFSIQLGAGYAF